MLESAIHDRVMFLNLVPGDSGGAAVMRADEERALIDALHATRSRPDISLIVLSAPGQPTFFAGPGLDELFAQRIEHRYDEWAASIDRMRQILIGLLDHPAVVIAKVASHAVGYGATLALACDYVIAADTAKIGDPHVKVGLTAGDGGAILWPHLIGLARARHFLLSGNLMKAPAAEAIGLIHKAVPRDMLDDAVDELVSELSALSPVALRTTKRAINMPVLKAVIESLDAHLGLETIAHLSAQHVEALQRALGG